MKVLELKSIRVKKGLTQQKLAEKLKISTTTYTKKENGVNPFTVYEIKQLKNILMLSNNEIIDIFFE